MWKIHKRTRQGVSAKLELYIYKVHMVCATNNYACPCLINRCFNIGNNIATIREVNMSSGIP